MPEHILNECRQQQVEPIQDITEYSLKMGRVVKEWINRKFSQTMGNLSKIKDR